MNRRRGCLQHRVRPHAATATDRAPKRARESRHRKSPRSASSCPDRSSLRARSGEALERLGQKHKHKIMCHCQLAEPYKSVLIRHCEPIVHRVQPACCIAMAGGHVLHFGPRKTMVFVLSAFRRGLGNGSLACIATVGKRRRNCRSSPGAITPSLRGAGSSFWVPLH